MRPQTQYFRSALDIGTIRTITDSNRQEPYFLSFLFRDARNGDLNDPCPVLASVLRILIPVNHATRSGRAAASVSAKAQRLGHFTLIRQNSPSFTLDQGTTTNSRPSPSILPTTSRLLKPKSPIFHFCRRAPALSLTALPSFTSLRNFAFHWRKKVREEQPAFSGISSGVNSSSARASWSLRPL